MHVVPSQPPSSPSCSQQDPTIPCQPGVEIETAGSSFNCDMVGSAVQFRSSINQEDLSSYVVGGQLEETPNVSQVSQHSQSVQVVPRDSQEGVVPCQLGVEIQTAGSSLNCDMVGSAAQFCPSINQEGLPSYVVVGQHEETTNVTKVSQHSQTAQVAPQDSQEGVGPSHVASDQQEEMSGGHNEVSQEGIVPSYVAVSPMDVLSDVAGSHQASIVNGEQCLNVDAEVFVVRDLTRLNLGRQGISLRDDECQVQQVQAGGVGVQDTFAVTLWNADKVSGIKPVQDQSRSVRFDSDLPFQGVEEIPDMLGIAPKQIQKVGKLLDMKVILPKGVFTDKVLPTPRHQLVTNSVFTADYFVALHNIVAAPGYRRDGTPYPANTPNHIGARVSLPHTKLNVVRWRHHLFGYEHVELVQYLEYGFPLGLDESFKLDCQTRNHGSAYMWYDWVDKFMAGEVKECGVTGPFQLSPWWNVTVSPLMTAHKKPLARRTVFDATFGEGSLNNATPGDKYLGQPIQFTYPKIEDYRVMVLKAGKGSFMWKRDLSRFFLQLPMDPVEYDKVGIVWRGLFFFFVGLAFGLRHSGLNGQRVTDAVSWVLRQLGQETEEGRQYQVCNYVDDLGGVESTEQRALSAYDTLGWLLDDLGLQESKKKAVPPTKRITYLGVQFDSEKMEMSVPPEKIAEVKSEIVRWIRKTTISKRELQSMLGKLFWVSKVIKYSRPFMGRLLEQLRSISKLHDGKKVKFTEEAKRDIRWWAAYLEHFNGVTMITNEEPIPLSYEQLLDSPDQICAGDATPTGGGAWHSSQYWCGSLPPWLLDPRIPIHLKEFWVIIVSAKVWGETWSGRTVTIFCDNDAVCDTVVHRKPRDPALLSLLREFLHLVVTWKFFPIVRKIGTKENEIADFISRRFDEVAAREVFAKFDLHNMTRVKPKTTFFNLSAEW